MSDLDISRLTAQEKKRLHALLAESVFQDETLPAIYHGDGSRPGPLYWLQECTKTWDPKWQAHGYDSPYQRFPDLPYLGFVFQEMMTRKYLLLAKSREMLMSWCAIAYGVWVCQTKPGSQVIVQRDTEEKGQDLIVGAGSPGYARVLYESQPPRVQAEFPLGKPMKDMPKDRIWWQNGSSIHSVPRGPDKIPGAHPTVVIWDEAALLDEEGLFMPAWSLMLPAAGQMIAVSSVRPGWFWEQCRRPATP